MPPWDHKSLRVWLVHDWLTGFRGGEKVLLELIRMFPRARVATLVHVPGTTHPQIDERVAEVSFLQKLPGALTGGYRKYLGLFPRAIRSLKLDDCDLVMSVSHAVAKGVRPPTGVPHVCYCHTPMRYIWGMVDQYGSWSSPRRWALAALGPGLRRFDRHTTGVTAFIANSRNVAARIARVYGRDSTVVHPGIDLDFYTPASKVPREDFYLMVGALVPFKRVDLAIRAFHGTRRLLIIGSGPEEPRLRGLAAGSNNISFLGHQPDDIVRDHYRRCAAFILPGEEDFGLTPLEAQACGAPVIALRAGGALETVIPGQTGIFFDRQTPTSLRAAVDHLETAGPLDLKSMRENARRFTWEKFRAGVLQVVEAALRNESPTADRPALFQGTV